MLFAVYRVPCAVCMKFFAKKMPFSTPQGYKRDEEKNAIQYMNNMIHRSIYQIRKYSSNRFHVVKHKIMDEGVIEPKVLRDRFQTGSMCDGMGWHGVVTIVSKNG